MFPGMQRGWFLYHILSVFGLQPSLICGENPLCFLQQCPSWSPGWIVCRSRSCAEQFISLRLRFTAPKGVLYTMCDI